MCAKINPKNIERKAYAFPALCKKNRPPMRRAFKKGIVMKRRKKAIVKTWSKLDWKGFVACVLYWTLSFLVAYVTMSFIVEQLQQLLPIPLPDHSGLWTGIIGWLVIVVYTLDNCVRFVDYQKITLSMGAGGNKSRRFMRSGLRFLVPFFEKLQRDPSDASKVWEIDLENENLPLGENKIRVFMTKDRLPIAVDYKGTLCPNADDDDHVGKYVLYDDEVIVRQFETLIDQNLSDLIAQRKQKDILSDKKGIANLVEQSFRTIPGTATTPVHQGLSDHFGVKLDNFAIGTIDLDKDVIEALKAAIKAKAMLTTVIALKKNGVDVNEALRAHLINEKKLEAKEHTVRYEGVPASVVTFAPGGNPVVGGTK